MLKEMGGSAADRTTVALRNGLHDIFVFITVFCFISLSQADDCPKLKVLTDHGCQPCSLCNPDIPGFRPILIRESCKAKHPNPIDHHRGEKLWCDSPHGPFPECPPIVESVKRSCDNTCEDRHRTFAPGCVCTVGCHGDRPSAVQCSRDLKWNSSIPTNCAAITTTAVPTSTVTDPGPDVSIFAYMALSVGFLAVLLLGIFLFCWLSKNRCRYCRKNEGPQSSGSSFTSESSGRSDKSYRTDSPLLSPSAPRLLTSDKEDKGHSLLILEKVDEGVPSGPDSQVEKMEVYMPHDLSHNAVGQPMAFAEVTLTSRPEQDDGALNNMALLGRESGRHEQDMSDLESGQQHIQEKMSVLLGPSLSSLGSTSVYFGPDDRESEKSVKKSSSQRALDALWNSRQAVCKLSGMFDHEDRFDRVTWHSVAAQFVGWDQNKIRSVEYMIRPSTGSVPGNGPMYQVLTDMQQSGKGLQEFLCYLESCHYRHREAEAFLTTFWIEWKQKNLSRNLEPC